MNGIVGSLRLGWHALLFKEDAYEEMGDAKDPVVKGLVLILIVGLAIALLNLVGVALEWASTPDLTQIKNIIWEYFPRMFWWEELARQDPGFLQQFRESYDLGWQIFPTLFGAPDIGSAALGIVTTPLGLLLRWLLYGVFAYLFARWLGGTGNFSQTLGVLALAVAPQALRALTFLPFVELGAVVSVWGILCAYVGLKTAHDLSWGRAAWATLLPFLLAIAFLVFAACLGSGIFAAVVRGG